MSLRTGGIDGNTSRSFTALALVSFSLLASSLSSLATIGVPYQMLLGNPSSATADPNNHQHYLLQRDIEALDYSDAHRQPNWASWHYTSSDSGTGGRSRFFFVDPSLPAGFYQVQTSDYSGSGYDRGHMCPSADRTDIAAHNEETFLMSNVIPQSPDNNQGVWANLESYCRTLASAGNEVLITCGPEGFGTNRTASSGQIPIASNVWKIIVVVPLGAGSTLDRITSISRVIAVNIPNFQGIRSVPWQNYLISVNQLQTNTGLTFFTALDTNLAAVLRARVDGAPACGITNLNPLSGSASSPIVLRGTNFTGVTAVAFNGAPTSFTVNSVNQITATVPAAATTGPISVIAAGGLTTSVAFTVNNPVIPQPNLAFTLAGTNLILSWPSTATGYTLQQNPDFDPNHWTPYPGAITNNGNSRTATIGVTADRMIFRLMGP